jgi:hypothetical protein
MPGAKSLPAGQRGAQNSGGHDESERRPQTDPAAELDQEGQLGYRDDYEEQQ